MEMYELLEYSQNVAVMLTLSAVNDNVIVAVNYIYLVQCQWLYITLDLNPNFFALIKIYADAKVGIGNTK